MNGYYTNYFIPIINSKRLKYSNNNIPEEIDGRLSDELFKKLEEEKRKHQGEPSTQWSYVADCVSRGTMTPMEAYECLDKGFVPEYMCFRSSYYVPYEG